jgi:hypothetical protein
VLRGCAVSEHGLAGTKAQNWRVHPLIYPFFTTPSFINAGPAFGRPNSPPKTNVPSAKTAFCHSFQTSSRGHISIQRTNTLTYSCHSFHSAFLSNRGIASLISLLSRYSRRHPVFLFLFAPPVILSFKVTLLPDLCDIVVANWPLRLYKSRHRKRLCHSFDT